MENMLKLGPKDMRGLGWDERGKSKIVQILISHGGGGIKAVQFAYVVDGNVQLSEIHGEPTGSKFDTVTFDHPSEHIVSVSGEYTGYGILGSFAFRTNYRKYGPFGGGLGYEYGKFKYNFGPRSCFAGFHGSIYNSTVGAIGVYVRPVGSLAGFYFLGYLMFYTTRNHFSGST